MKVPFHEYAAAPLQHVFPTLAVRVCGQQAALPISSRVQPVLRPNATAEEKQRLIEREEKRDKSARATVVPVAVLPNGVVLKDSWEIAAHSGLPMTNLDPQLKSLLDEEIGPLCRQMVYFFILNPKNQQIWDKLCTENFHFIWRLIWYAGVGGYVKKMLIKVMKADDPAALADCRVRLAAAMGRLDNIVLAKKTEFIAGDRIGVADVALASLLSPIINAPEYYGGKFTHLMDSLMQSDDSLRKEVEAWRATASGEYALALYTKYRLCAD